MIRFFDFILAVSILIIAIPFIASIAVIILIFDRQNPFFLQKRVGLHNVEFTLFKFQTMTKDQTHDSWATAKDERITKIGRFLRKSHLDELPQLVNILIGNMSFVGPRPFRKKIIEQIKELEPEFEIRTRVKPGLTGYAQLHTDKGINLECHINKLQYDKLYIENPISLIEYFKLLFLTFLKFFRMNSH